MSNLYTTESDEMIEVELKPCSVCGSNAIESVAHKRYVNCSIPWCPNGEKRMPKGMHFDVWNNRPIEDKLKAEIAALEQQNKELLLMLQAVGAIEMVEVEA